MKKRNRTLRKKVFKRDNFTCQKCSFKDLTCGELEVHHIIQKVDGGAENLSNLITLCSICHHFVPNLEEDFKHYIKEKVDRKTLETFRKSNRSTSKRTVKGMQNHFLEGKHITKAPKGYKLVNKKLIIDEEKAENVKKSFEEFLNSDISLTQLAKNQDMTTAGIKKLLKNTTYLGKVKFAGIESQGEHNSIIPKDLFDKVQEKLSKITK